MAYDFVPKTVQDITKQKQLGNAGGQLVTLWQLLESIDSKIKEPLAIDIKKKAVKVLPDFEKKIGKNDFKSKYKFTIKIDFGRGTRGIAKLSKGKMVSKDKEEGGGNKGILFEREYTKNLLAYQKGDRVSNTKHLKAIHEMTYEYKLGGLDVQIIPEGELNKKRPIVFQGSNIYIGSSNFDIGATVTDITLKTFNPKSKKTDYVYLSLKYGNTVTFFNSGVQKIFTKNDIMSGTITNPDGLTILKLFGIQPKKFCSVFNSYGSGKIVSGSEDTFKDVDKNMLKGLIKSGVGYGYYLVHMANNGDIHQYRMTKEQLEKASTPQSCTVYYGGLTGGGKRIDMVVETPMFTLKFNIRSKFRGIVNPTHMMCDYVIKH
jgi:hypothetical protein